MATPSERRLWFPPAFRTVHRTQWDVYVDGRLNSSYPSERAAGSFVAVFCLGRKTAVIRREISYAAGEPCQP